MDGIITIGYIIGGLLAIGIAFVIVYVVGLACLMVIGEFVSFIFRILCDTAFSLIVFPFYLLFHPVKCFTNTREFSRGFYIKLPYAGEHLRTEIALQKDKEYLNKMTPKEREEELRYRKYMWDKEQRETKEYYDWKDYRRRNPI